MKQEGPRQQPAGWSAFSDLAGAMYALRRRCPSLTLLATSTVHPRHVVPAEHFELMRAMAVADGRVEIQDSVSAFAKQFILSVLVAAWDTCTILALKLSFSSKLRKVRQAPVSVAMKTWCFGPGSVNSDADFYFGDLHKRLPQRGVNCLLICGNVLAAKDLRFAAEIFRQKDLLAVPELMLVPVWAPFYSVCRQVATVFRLRRQMSGIKERNIRLVCRQASVDCLHPNTTRNLMHYYVAKTVGKYWRPAVFVTLFEGQPSEKQAWHGMKSGWPGCKLVGYQHTTVMRHSLSVSRPNRGSWEIVAPDVVLCLGEPTVRMISAGYEGTASKLVIFGSHRRPKSEGELHGPRLGDRTVIVVPEGNLSESRLLFNFALSAARLLPDHRFIFRCHPLLPFETIREHLNQDVDALANVVVSQESAISTDFARSSVVLYRGSSAVSYAVLDGLRPVYVRSESDIFDVDPLFELQTWRDYVSSENELCELLRGYTSLGDSEAMALWKPAWDYVNSYTVPVDEASIDRFVTAVGIQPSRN